MEKILAVFDMNIKCIEIYLLRRWLYHWRVFDMNIKCIEIKMEAYGRSKHAEFDMNIKCIEILIPIFSAKLSICLIWT